MEDRDAMVIERNFKFRQFRGDILRGGGGGEFQTVGPEKKKKREEGGTVNCWNKYAELYF